MTFQIPHGIHRRPSELQKIAKTELFMLNNIKLLVNKSYKIKPRRQFCTPVMLYESQNWSRKAVDSSTFKLYER